MDFTEQRDLRGGTPCWQEGGSLQGEGDPLPEASEILVIGAGVMGAMIADRLSGDGREVTLIDRRPPAQGSTSASTALIMWAADVPLTHLARAIGMREATARWQSVHEASARLRALIDDRRIDCGRMDRPELYLDGDLLNADGLEAEVLARRAAGFGCRYLAPGEAAERFGIAPRAAIVCDGSYVLDPVRLTRALLDRARSQGASLCFPYRAVGIDHQGAEIVVTLADGEQIRCRHLMIATGYERAPWLLPAAFTVGSSYAIATRPGTPPRWREDAMIWEASTSYLYARRTPEGRIIVGGGDEDFADAERRDALIGEKRGLLEARLLALAGDDEPAIDCAWSANFGNSPDGLPAIGRSTIDPRIWIASGFGGNGITFASLAADMIGMAMLGGSDARMAQFRPDRF